MFYGSTIGTKKHSPAAGDPTSSQIESGLIAESHDQYLRLKTAPPVGAFGTGAEGRDGAGAVCE